MIDEIEEVKVEELENDKVVTYVTTYLQTFNKTDAYVASHPESSRQSAMTNTFRYWNNPKVQAAIRAILEDALIGTDELKLILTNMARGGNGIKKAEQLKAIELIMKSKGMMLDRMDISSGGKSISWQNIINGEVKENNAGNITLLG